MFAGGRNEVFIPERGTRKEANKVIVIITDGDASDRDRGHIEAVKKKNILRLIIGVKYPEVSIWLMDRTTKSVEVIYLICDVNC